MSLTASGVVISNGGSSVNITPSAVTITNGSFSATSGSVSVRVDSSNYVKVSDSSNNFVAQLSNFAIQVSYTGSSASGYIHMVPGGTPYGELVLEDGAGNQLSLQPVFYTIAGAGARTLPSNPDGFYQISTPSGVRKVPYYL